MDQAVTQAFYGFHVVAADRRIPGETLLFDAARGRIAE
jgi:hypothetical protein